MSSIESSVFPMGGTKFIIPYNSHCSVSGNWVYSYWGPHSSTIISSSDEFKSGDAMKLVKLDYERRIIYVDKVIDGSEPLSTMLFVSNDIPLDTDDEYNISYQGCQPIYCGQDSHYGNKTYTLAILVESTRANVRAICHKGKTRWSFNIDGNYHNG